MAAAAAVSITASSSDAPNGKATDLRSTFEQVYNRLKSELLEDPAFDFTDDSRQWIERVRNPTTSLSLSLPSDLVGFLDCKYNERFELL